MLEHINLFYMSLFWDCAPLQLWPPYRCSCKSLTWFNKHGLWNNILSYWCQNKTLQDKCNFANCFTVQQLLFHVQNQKSAPFYCKTAYAYPSNSCSIPYEKGKSEPEKLIDLFFFYYNFISIQFNALQFKRHLFYVYFCLVPKIKGESVKTPIFKELKIQQVRQLHTYINIIIKVLL